MEIGIVGLGLIGGSLGLKLRSLGHHVTGVSRRVETCTQAMQLGAVDQANTALSVLKETEFIFLATPLDAIVPTAEKLCPLLSSTTCLTDVGSAKAEIVKALESFWPNFVGGHPMAGKAESGIEVAEATLFEQRPYILTPTAQTPPKAIELLTTLVRSLGSTIYQSSPEAHDSAVAWISHLPVMVSASLIQACRHETDAAVLTLAQQLASSGFQDTSRVGGGNPDLGVLMARYNRQALLHSLTQYRQQLEQVTQWIETGNWMALTQCLEATQAARPQFL